MNNVGPVTQGIHCLQMPTTHTSHEHKFLQATHKENECGEQNCNLPKL